MQECQLFPYPKSLLVCISAIRIKNSKYKLPKFFGRYVLQNICFLWYFESPRIFFHRTPVKYNINNKSLLKNSWLNMLIEKWQTGTEYLHGYKSSTVKEGHRNNNRKHDSTKYSKCYVNWFWKVSKQNIRKLIDWP